MKRKDIFNILFWILLIIVIILILWRIFGNSPSDLSIIVAALFTILLKIWVVSDEFKEFKHEVKFSFYRARKDIDSIKNKEMIENNFPKFYKTAK